MTIEIPNKGFIYWPVGTGDTSTIRVDETVFLQIDLHHKSAADEESDPAWPVIDYLEEALPKKDGRPYLSTFALTHPDQDHCKGFEDLMQRVDIGELWMSPRTFREYADNDATLCDDAEAFHDEAMRRVEAVIDAGGDPGSGDRIRIIGYDDWLEEDEFKGFPEEFLTIPGNALTCLDGEDHEHHFRAFVHAPFKEDSFSDRNDCSLAFQISLIEDESISQALFLGDLSYEVIKRIFTYSDEDTVSWHVLLAPHHCSKSVMYTKDGDNEVLQEDIMDDFATAQLDPGFIVASSEPIPAENKSGDNPPHAKAKTQYEGIVANEFLCTMDHPDEGNPVPIVFQATADGLSYLGQEVKSASLKETLKAVGGAAAAPKDATGFGASAIK